MKDRFQQFWKQSSPRERWLIGSGFVGVLAVLMFFYVWQPLYQDRTMLRANLPQLRANAEQMHLNAAEVIQLKAHPSEALIPIGGIREAVEQSAASYNLQDGISQISDNGGGRISIAMTAVSFDSWVRWLAHMQAQYRIRLATCQIEALSQPGMVKVQAVLVGNTKG